MLRVLGRARSVLVGGCGWFSLLTFLVLWVNVTGLSYAQVTNSNLGNQWAARIELGACPTGDQVANLNPGDSIKLSRLVGVDGLSLQVGDKLFDNFSVDLNDVDGDHADNLRPNTIWVTALSDDTGYGISFTGPFKATGKNHKDLTIYFSVSVTDPNYLISDVHLSSSNAVYGMGFSSVVDKVFTDASQCDQAAELDVLNTGDTNPVFEDLANLTPPRDSLYLKQMITLGGGGIRGRNQATIVSIDNTFSQTVIPEPSTIALSAAGLLVLFFAKYRKRR